MFLFDNIMFYLILWVILTFHQILKITHRQNTKGQMFFTITKLDKLRNKQNKCIGAVCPLHTMLLQSVWRAIMMICSY